MQCGSDYPELETILHNEALFSTPPKLSVHALPDRQYLEATVLPILLNALEAAAAERPKDALEYIAAYLVSNNPQRNPNGLPPVPHDMLFGTGHVIRQQLAARERTMRQREAENSTAAAPAAPTHPKKS